MFLHSAADADVLDEEADDEHAAPLHAKKKKKKKPKKKKKSAAAQADAAATDPADVAVEETFPLIVVLPNISSTAPEVLQQTPRKRKKLKKRPPVEPEQPTPSRPSAPSEQPWPSILSVSQEQHAQSAHSYMRSENLDTTAKTKVKSRPAFATILQSSDKKGKSKASEGGNGAEKDGKTDPGSNFVARLSKKAKNSFNQLMGFSKEKTQGSKGMKWESFLRVCSTCLLTALSSYRSSP